MTEPGLQFIWQIFSKTFQLNVHVLIHFFIGQITYNNTKLKVLTLLLKTHNIPYIPKYGYIEIMVYVFIKLRKQIGQERKGISASKL